MIAPLLIALLAVQAPVAQSRSDTISTPIVSDTAVAAVPSSALLPVITVPPVDEDTVRRRRHAVEYSDAYNTRLTIHRIGSYVELPLFAAEYSLGQNLLNDSRPASWLKPTHAGVALGLGALFTVNTVTGLWNLWDARNDPADRPRRYIHTALMLAADAGFAWAGATGGDAGSVDAERHHRAIALTSIGISTVGTAIMWFWKS